VFSHASRFIVRQTQKYALGFNGTAEEGGTRQPPGTVKLFHSAVGHFNPGGKKHGLMAPEGPHAGDMPNLHVPQSGELVVEVLNSAITLERGKAAPRNNDRDPCRRGRLQNRPGR